MLLCTRPSQRGFIDGKNKGSGDTDRERRTLGMLHEHESKMRRFGCLFVSFLGEKHVVLGVLTR